MADKPQAQAVVPYEEFRNELLKRQDEFVALLPSTISREAFTNVAVIAVKQNPELLQCDRRSLHKAVTMAARDGLMPDGKEGVILPQKEKVMVDGKETWIKSARWQAMTYGIRKRARELDDIVIDAQVVHQNDHFRWLQGDDPRIEHEPAPLGQERGKMVGAYAIFKRGNSVLHREVMNEKQIEAVHAISRSPGGLMWKSFTEEAWRKTVVRRGSKTLPCSEKLRETLQGDDDLYDVSDHPPPLSPPPAPQRRSALPPAAPAHEPEPEAKPEPPQFDPEAYLARLTTALHNAASDHADAAGDVQIVWNQHLEKMHAKLNEEQQKRAEGIYASVQKSVSAAKATQQSADQKAMQL
jgi:recombination protein RecT